MSTLCLKPSVPAEKGGIFLFCLYFSSLCVTHCTMSVEMINESLNVIATNLVSKVWLYLYMCVDFLCILTEKTRGVTVSEADVNLY